MGISKIRAIELIEQKIIQVKEIQDKANLSNIFDSEYEFAYHSSETLLIQLFSEKEKNDFRRSVSTFFGLPDDPSRKVYEYKKLIDRCITQLEVYKERIENFWPDETKVSEQREREAVNVQRSKRAAVNYYAEELHIGDKIHTSVGDVSNNGQIFVGKVNNVVANLSNSGQTDLAQALKSLTDAVIMSKDLLNDKKEEQVQIISQVGKEATEPKPNKTLLKILTDGLVATLKAIPDIANVVTKVTPVLNDLHLHI